MMYKYKTFDNMFVSVCLFYYKNHLVKPDGVWFIILICRECGWFLSVCDYLWKTCHRKAKEGNKCVYVGCSDLLLKEMKMLEGYFRNLHLF